MGVLTSVGILKGGKLSESIKNKYISEVKSLLGNGNPQNDPFWFVPIPPFFINPLPIPELEKKEKFPIWHLIFIDTLLQGTAKALDLNGSTPFFPVADPCNIAVQLGLPLPDLDLETSLSLPTPDVLLELLELDPLDIPDILAKLPEIQIPGIPSPPSIPSIPLPNLFIPTPILPISFSLAVPIPSLPPIPAPIFPDVPTFQIPTLAGMPSLMGCLLGAIPLIFLQVVIQFPKLTQSFSKGPQGIIEFFAGIIITIILACFEELGLLVNTMLSFIAALVVYIKYLIIFCILAIIAALLGEGCITNGLADLLLA